MPKVALYPLKTLGIIPVVAEPENLSQAVGGNTGNLAFVFPYSWILSNQVSPLSDIHYSEDSLLIITAANWISSENESKSPISISLLDVCRSFGNYAIIGLGCQAGLDVSPSEYICSINPAVKARLLEFLDGAKAIAVRDKFTQSVIRTLNPCIDSIVLGCISNFTCSSRSLETSLSEGLQSAIRKSTSENAADISFAITEHTINPLSISETRKMLASTLQLNKLFPRADYVIQSKYMIPELYKYKNPHENLLDKFLSKDGFKAVAKICNSYGKCYRDIPSWTSSYSNTSLCFGWRIHGTILALQAGCPSIVFSHDARVKGLADSMKIPQLSLADVYRLTHESVTPSGFLESVLSSLQSQLVDYFDERVVLYNGWISFLRSLNLDLSHEFLSLYPG